MVGDGILWFAEYKHPDGRFWNYGILSISPFAFQPNRVPKFDFIKGDVFQQRLDFLRTNKPAGEPVLIKQPTESCLSAVTDKRFNELKNSISKADRIYACGKDFSLVLYDATAKQIVKAVASSRPSPPTQSIFNDFTAYFFKGTNFLALIGVEGSHFSLIPPNERQSVQYYKPDGTLDNLTFWACDEFCDNSGELERMYDVYRPRSQGLP
jgi:hypothetical protein